jgi:hypothetical protein
MAVRKLGEIIRCICCGQLSATGKQWEGTCNGDASHGLTETVTAYDSRDVDPLLEAARLLISDDFSKSPPRWVREQLSRALAPFDSEEKT